MTSFEGFSAPLDTEAEKARLEASKNPGERNEAGPEAALTEAGIAFNAAFPEGSDTFEGAQRELRSIQAETAGVQSMEEKIRIARERRGRFMQAFDDGVQRANDANGFRKKILGLSSFLKKVGGNTSGPTNAEINEAEERAIAEASAKEIVGEVRSVVKNGDVLLTYGEDVALAMEHAAGAAAKERGDKLGTIEKAKIQAQAGATYIVKNPAGTLAAIKAGFDLYRQFEKISHGTGA